MSRSFASLECKLCENKDIILFTALSPEQHSAHIGGSINTCWIKKEKKAQTIPSSLSVIEAYRLTSGGVCKGRRARVSRTPASPSSPAEKRVRTTCPWLWDGVLGSGPAFAQSGEWSERHSQWNPGTPSGGPLSLTLPYNNRWHTVIANTQPKSKKSGWGLP